MTQVSQVICLVNYLSHSDAIAKQSWKTGRAILTDSIIFYKSWIHLSFVYKINSLVSIVHIIQLSLFADISPIDTYKYDYKTGLNWLNPLHILESIK